MFQTLKNAALNLLGYIPIIKNFVPEKYKNPHQFSSKTRPELESFHRRANSSKGFSNPAYEETNKLDNKGWSADPLKVRIEKTSTTNNQKDWNTNPYDKEQNFAISKPITQIEEWEKQGKQVVINALGEQKFETIKSSFELNKAINDHIRKRSNNSDSPIDFQPDVIRTATLNSFNALVESYKRTFPIIHDPNLHTEIDPNVYIKLMQDYISRSLSFIIELEGRLMNQVIKIDPNSSDLDIAKAIGLHRELSKSIAETTLRTIMQSFELLPGVAFITEQGREEKIASIIGKELRDSLRTLYLGSKFGIHSKEIVEAFKAKVQKIYIRDDVTVHKSLTILNELQNSIHGSLVQDADVNKHSQEIAQLDASVINHVLENLIKVILKEFVINYDEIDDKQQRTILRPLNYCKNDLAMFLTKSAEIESETQRIINANKSDKVWLSINLNSEHENQNIEQVYSIINNQTNAILGYTNTETIKKIQVPGTQISNYLKGENLNKHFARIIHEVSLVAAIDALAEFRKAKTSPGKALNHHSNFQTIPWLKDFYSEKYKQYLSWVESPQATELETRKISKELCQLGEELHHLGYFDFDDFASDSRYKIAEDTKKLLDRAADHTDMGVLAMTLEIFSTLFSYLEYDEKGPFKPEEVKRIQDLVSFLKKESILIGADGRQVVAPKKPNPLGVAKAEYMKKLVGSRGFLTLNTPIIIKFLEKSLGISGQNQGVITKQDSLLATLLFYVLVKYTPASVNDVDSLKAKAKIFKLCLKLYSRGEDQLPVLYKKLCKQVLGLNDEINAGDPSRGNGLFKSMIIELENKISNYAKQKQEYDEARLRNDSVRAAAVKPPIELYDLLEVYADIENTLRGDTQAAKRIEETLYKLKNISGPLIHGIKEMIKASIQADIHTTVEFVKQLNNEDLTQYTEKLLLDAAANCAKTLLANNIDREGRLIIGDYRKEDQEAIKNFTNLLEYIKHTGYLLNQYGVSRINIRGSTVAAKEDSVIREQIINSIASIKDLLSRKIALIANASTLEEEVFPGQFEAKRTLLELVREPEFRLKPAFGTMLTWIPSDRKLQEAAEAPYIISGFQSERRAA